MLVQDAVEQSLVGGEEAFLASQVAGFAEWGHLDGFPAPRGTPSVVVSTGVISQPWLILVTAVPGVRTVFPSVLPGVASWGR